MRTSPASMSWAVPRFFAFHPSTCRSSHGSLLHCRDPGRDRARRDPRPGDRRRQNVERDPDPGDPGPPALGRGALHSAHPRGGIVAAIKIKNFLRLGSAKRQVIWDQLRDEPMMEAKVTMKDLFGPIGAILRFSVSGHGVAVFLIGEDPGPELEEATPSVG